MREEELPFDGSYFTKFIYEYVGKKAKIQEYLDALSGENRFFVNDSLSKYILDISSDLEKHIEKDTYYYRARVMHEKDSAALQNYHEKLREWADRALEKAKDRDANQWVNVIQWIFENDLSNIDGTNSNDWEIYDEYSQYANSYDKDFSGFPADKVGAPPKNLAKEGRVNPAGVAYLYLAETEHTAIWEIKPSVGQLISVAKFNVNKRLKVIDVSLPIDLKEMKNMPQNVLEDRIALSFLFSKPKEDEDGFYWKTQYVAECFKSLGFEGIIFTSSIDNNGRDYNQKRNLVLFDACYDQISAKAVDSKVFYIEGPGIESQVLPIPLFD